MILRRFVFTMIYSFLFSIGILSAQNPSGFSLELSGGGGYSSFLLEANEFIPLWSQSGIHTKTRGGLLFHLGLGVVKPLTSRIQVRLGLNVNKGAFVYRMEGLRFGTDITNPTGNGENTSTFKATFQFWNLEVPLLADFHLSSKPSSYFISTGVGILKNINNSGKAILQYSDGTEGEPIIPSYNTANINSFILLGFGKSIPITEAKQNLLLRLNARYFFVSEDLSFFATAGRLLNTSIEVAYRF